MDEREGKGRPKEKERGINEREMNVNFPNILYCTM
jgi:hypothetical protein